MLQHILIPPAVKTIDNNVFQGCTNILKVQFCPRIEEFVASEAIRNWWNQGLHKQCFTTYCFLVRCNILERLGFVPVQNAQANIFDMLGRVPTIRQAKKLDSFFASIDSRLLFYESLMHSAALLELVFWKSKIIDYFSPSNIPLLTMEMKMQCRHDSIRMVSIIVPNVMSFLIGDDRDQRRRWRSRR